MAAINPISEANLLSNSWVFAAALAEAKVRQLIADRVSMRQVAVDFVGDIAGTNSKTSRTRRAGIGHSLSMTTAATETEEGSATTLTIENGDVTVGRHYVILEETQLAQIVMPDGDLDPDVLAGSFVDAWEGKFMDVLADTIDDFTTDIVNTSAADASVDDLYDTADEFETNDIDGPIYGALAGKQIGDIRQSFRAEGGPLQFRSDVQALQGMPGFMFEVLDLNIFRVNKVKTTAGSREGAFWAPGALGWNMGSTSRVKTGFGAVKPAGLPLIIGFEFNEKKGTVEIVGNAYFGEAIIYDALGRGFVTKS